MGLRHKKSLLLLITNSYAATNIIHSGLVKELAEYFNLKLISNLIGDRELSQINDHFGIQMKKIHLIINEENYLIRFLRQIEKALFFSHFKIDTQKIKYRQSAFLYRNTVRIILTFIEALAISEILLRILRKTIILITGNNRYFKDWNPSDIDGVISTSPLDIRENAIINYFRIKRIPSLAIVISWDNLTSKGVINADHDCVLVWNHLMADEFRRFYSIFKISKQQMHITGVPRFDVYYKPLPARFSVESFRQEFEIPCTHQVILFATSAINHCPDQADIVEHLLEYARNKPITIIIRCHPGDDHLEYNRFICEPNIRIWRTQSDSRSFPDLDTLSRLASMLRACDVCIQIASTIRIEAAICNKPCISIAYDGNRSLSAINSIKRLYAYSHQIPLNQLKLDQQVNSKTELFESLYLIFQRIQIIDHTSQIQQFVHYTEPISISATTNHIRAWLK
jgi:hypothetical protein